MINRARIGDRMAARGGRRWIAHVLAGGVVIGLAGLSSASCLVTDTPTFFPPDGSLVSGSIMCSLCSSGAFCLDPATGDTDEQQGGVCPAGWIASVPASRVVSLTSRSVNFHCIPPDGKDMDGAAPMPFFDPGGVRCPADPAARAAHEFLDVCQDVPLSCRRPPVVEAGECAPEDLPDPSDPQCPPGTELGLARTACAENPGGNITLGAAAAVDKLNVTMAPFGQDVPSAPARYCYTSCLDAGFCLPCPNNPQAICCPGCDEAAFDPPEIRPGSVVASLDPSASDAVIIVDIGGTQDSAIIPVTGRVALDIPAACFGPLPAGESASCQAAVPWIELEGAAPAVLGGEIVTDIRIQNPMPVDDDLITVGDASIVSLPMGTELFVEADITNLGRKGTLFVPTSPLITTIDWSSRALNVILTLSEPSSSLTLTLAGTIPNLPPIADAGPDQAVECEGVEGAMVALSGAASTDPDGPGDLVGYTWHSPLGGQSRLFNGADWVVPASFGTTSFTLNVTDTSGAIGSDAVVVEVADTTGPTFDSVDIVADCLWPPNHEMLLFELGDELSAEVSDACDEAPSLAIVSVTSNQPENGLGDGNTAPDVVFGGGALCVRAERAGNLPGPREYLVVLEAADAAGNTTQHSLVIQVPHDKGSGPKGCKTPASLEVVEPDDPRCVAGAPQPLAAFIGPSESSPLAASLEGLPAPLEGGSDPVGSGCTVEPRGASTDRTGGWVWVAVALGLFARSKRRRRSRALGSVVIGVSLLLQVGCDDQASSSTPPAPSEPVATDPSSLEACVQGVWFQKAQPCMCPSGGILVTPECDAADCTVNSGVALRIVEGKGQSADFLMHRSDAMASVTPLGGFGGVTEGTWRITSASELEQTASNGNLVGPHPTRCDDTVMIREGWARYDRAPSALADALLAEWDSGTWATVSTGP